MVVGVNLVINNYSRRLASGTTKWDTSIPQKTHLNLLEIHEIGPVDTSESNQQNYDQI